MQNQLEQQFNNALQAVIKNWLDAHPILSWIVYHPLETLGIILLLLVLFQGLLGAIARLTEQFWLSLFKFLFKFVQLLVGMGSKSVKNAVISRSVQSRPNQNDKRQRLATIITRLEEMRTEQDELLQEVKALLASGERQNSRRRLSND